MPTRWGSSRLVHMASNSSRSQDVRVNCSEDLLLSSDSNKQVVKLVGEGSKGHS